ncbi:hypothetical protein KIMH_04420 [Bombiscardovia apis]|uniref:Major facilitator superfamily (MFS) profile domain-containing protein n=1 Tax=Bombiscardovia apis TaxID=2932182 RepID=A0ABM8BBX4_9BIFI|nr:MFS transporter [Bombiscardovia apis]BDR54331.1 hypothetical protein KIMH_04420 [Bombiscardovia apis]
MYNLGNSDAAGLALMFNTGASIVIGLLINSIKQVCKNMTIPFSLALFAAGALLLLFTRSLPITCLAAFLIGSGSAIIMATCPFMLSNLTERKRYPLVMGLFSAITSLGFTSSTWFFKAVSGAFNIDPVTGSLWGIVIISVVVCVLLVVFRFQQRTDENYLFE